MLAGGAWLAYDLARAARDLTSARRALAGAARLDALLDPTGRARVLSSLDDGQTSAAWARDRLTGSVPLRVAAVVPAVGHQRKAAIVLASDAVVAAGAGRDMVATIDRLAGANEIRDGQLPLDAMAALEASAADAARVLRPTVRRSASLWGPLRDARDAYDTEIGDAAVRLQAAADALGAARTFAGEAGPRSYLVAGQNNAELRDQGMVLSYAVLRFEGGRFDIGSSGPITDLTLRQPAPTPLGPGTAELFGALEPTRVWQSVNATADVAWSSEAMLDMYAAATGERLDGVVMIDVPALAQILRVVGPVSSPGIDGTITADNAVGVLLNDLYEQLPVGADQGPRREAIAGVARSTVQRLSSAPHDPLQLGRALANAAMGGHLRLHSREPGEQAVFQRVGLAGGPATGPDGGANTFHYAVQNATGTKLDYFLRHRVRFDLTTTGAGNVRVRTTVTVTNRAPSDASPSYVMGPTSNQERPGQYAGRVHLWGPAGSEQFESVEESGLRATMQLVVADPQTEASTTFETLLKGVAADGVIDLRLVPQPLVVPADVEVVVDGERRVSRRWDRTLELELTV